MAASTERTVPSVNSFTLPDTLPAVLLANPGACVTGASGLGHTGRARRETPPPSRLPLAIPADPRRVLRLRLVREPRFALTPSLLRIHSVACTCDMSLDTRRP